MTTYYAKDIIDQDLYAKSKVLIKSSAVRNSETKRVVPAGGFIGVIDSWLPIKEGRDNLWWVFYDYENKSYSYIEHSDAIDYEKLIGNGNILSVRERIIKAEEDSKTTFEKVAQTVGKGLVAFGVLKVISSLVGRK